jgi:hypothetical protein
MVRSVAEAASPRPTTRIGRVCLAVLILLASGPTAMATRSGPSLGISLSSVGDRPENPAGPASASRMLDYDSRTTFTNHHQFVATKSLGEAAGGVAKGPIADAVPKNLTEQLALQEAKVSGGVQIMENLGDAPRLVANYGEGTWVKMQSVLRGANGNTTVHWFKNLTSGLEVEFKFK